MRAIDKLNSNEVIDPESFSEGIVDKGHRDTPIDSAALVLDYFDYSESNDLGKLIWIIFDNYYLNDNDKLFQLLDAAKENGGKLMTKCLIYIIHHGNKDISSFMCNYLMDNPFYDCNTINIENELINTISITDLETDYRNNNVDYEYLDNTLVFLEENDLDNYYALIERLICFSRVDGWDYYFALGWRCYDRLDGQAKQIIDGNIK